MPQPPKTLTQELRTLCLALIIFAPIGYLILAPRFDTRPDGSARLTAAQIDLATLQAALEKFHADLHRYPTTAEGLNALIKNPNLPNWHGPYLPDNSTRDPSLPKNDPWANDYHYGNPNPTKPYTLFSNGPDGIPLTPDITPTKENSP